VSACGIFSQSFHVEQLYGHLTPDVLVPRGTSQDLSSNGTSVPQSLGLRPILAISIAIVSRGTPRPCLFVQPARCAGGLSPSRHCASCLARNVPRGTNAAHPENEFSLKRSPNYTGPRGTRADSSRSLNRRLCGPVPRPRLRPRIVSESRESAPMESRERGKSGKLVIKMLEVFIFQVVAPTLSTLSRPNEQIPPQ
jgi:hypothetical protein